MTRRAPTYLRQPGDGDGLMPRQASIILHMGVVKAPLCKIMIPLAQEAIVIP